MWEKEFLFLLFLGWHEMFALALENDWIAHCTESSKSLLLDVTCSHSPDGFHSAVCSPHGDSKEQQDLKTKRQTWFVHEKK